MMHTKPQRVTPPSNLPLDLATAKQHLSVGFDRHDTLIDGYIAAAVDKLDGPSGKLGRFLCTQVWRTRFDGITGGIIRLPFIDVQSVVVTYQDEVGADQTIDASNYEFVLETRGASIIFYRDFQCPTFDEVPYPVTVTMTVGYGEPEDVPFALKTALMMIVARLYENREGLGEGVSEIPSGVESMIEHYKVKRF